MSRSVGFRLIALLVVAILGVYYIAFDAVGVRLWNGPYTVSVMLPAGGGIYSDASVTYRGVQIGKVESLHLMPTAVKVDLAIDHGQRIPANVHASVKELTAAAEQYMELTPAGEAGPATDPPSGVGYLQAGSVIPMDRTSIPISVGTLLNTTNALADSLHPSQLNTIATSLAQGLQGAGPALREIIVDGKTLIEALNSEVPATISAIDNGNQVLNTLNATGGDLQTFAAGLDRLSGTVAAADANLAALFANGATATAAFAPLLQQTNPSNVGVINGFSETAGLANARQGAMKAFFQILPVVAHDAALTIDGSGTPRFQVTVNSQNTVCPYVSQMVEPTSLVAAADLTRNCGTTASDLLQRGAGTAPTPSGGTP